MAHYGDMRIRPGSLLLGLCLSLALLIASTLPGIVGVAAATSMIQPIDEEVPPGNPVLGSDRPGDIPEGDGTNYVLWGVVAACLIGAGVLLVKVERWEARRIED